MSSIIKCEVCSELIVGSLEAHAMHLKRYHGVTSRREYIPMDRESKARIVARVEHRLGSLIIGGQK